MQPSDECGAVELDPKLAWLFGLAPLPRRPRAAPVRVVRCRSAEDVSDDEAQMSAHERARDRRTRMFEFVRSQGREVSTSEVAAVFMVSDSQAFNDLQCLAAGRRLKKRVELSRSALARVFWRERT